MSQFIGDRIPPPLRFDLGKPAPPDEIAQTILLATVDESGAPRIAVLAGSEIAVSGDRALRIGIPTEHATCANLIARPHASLWCVLDGAAYTIQLNAERSGSPADGEQPFALTAMGVWCDFRPDAPMVAGATYRKPRVD